MKIIVLVKHVPDAQFDRHLNGEGYTTDRDESILSELDEYALEAALQLAEARGGSKAGNQVIALSMGPAGAVNAVKKSLQMGATEGVHLTDDALAGSDAAATSLALAAAIRHLGAGAPWTSSSPAWPPPTAKPPWCRRSWPSASACPQVTFASSLDGRRRTAHRPPRRRHLLRDRGSPAAGRGLRDGPDQRAALPQLQGHHRGQAQEHHHAVPGRHRRRSRAGGPRRILDHGDQSAEERPPRTAGTIITDEGDAGIKLVDFLAAQKLL